MRLAAPLLAALLLPALLSPPAAPAEGRVLRVGPGEALARPSEAARVARPGDAVEIAPGTYEDCASWRTPDLAIRAAPGGPVVITGPACEGKALFVVSAPRVVVEGITFRGARVPDGNGAGIRAEGGDLLVRRSVFEDNENGILTRARLPGASLVVEDSLFLRNGALRDGRDCAHGLYAGHLDLVRVVRTAFRDTRVCHHLKSRADRTEVLDSAIEDGPEGRASYLVDLPNGGDLLLRGSLLRKGPPSGNPWAAVVVGAEGVRRETRSLVVEGNRLENRMLLATTFLANRSATPAILSGNAVRGPVSLLAGPGEVR